MKKLITLFTITILCACFMMAQNDARLLRFPAVHGEKVVFTYAGDLFEVPLSGGIARKLTSDTEGYEMFARFSPDGKHIAFTGQYDGNTEVYLISSEGGVPERLTYTATLGRDDISDRMGPNNVVMAWSDNDHIVYRSRKQTFNSLKVNCLKYPKMADCLKNCHYQPVDGVLSHLMEKKWHTTVYFASSEPGSIIRVAWPMMFGYMTLKPKKQSISLKTTTRIFSRCGQAITFIFCQTGTVP